MTPIRDRIRTAIVTGWFAIGIGFIAVDEHIQPGLAELGHARLVQAIAVAWQELATTFGIILFLLSGLVSVKADRGRTFVHFAICIASAGATVQVIKRLIGRARPYVFDNTTHFFGPYAAIHWGFRGPYDSMPSGHTTAAFAMAAALSCRWPRAAVAWNILAAGAGAARILTDVHFPSDVILGALLGTIVGSVVCRWTSGSPPIPAYAVVATASSIGTICNKEAA